MSGSDLTKWRNKLLLKAKVEFKEWRRQAGESLDHRTYTLPHTYHIDPASREILDHFLSLSLTMLGSFCPPIKQGQ